MPAERRKKSAPPNATGVLPGLGAAGGALPAREPPYNLDAEEGLLGCCIIDGGRETLTVCVEEKIVPESFYKPAHKIIFQVLLDLYNENSVVDEVVLADKLMGRTVSTLGGRLHDPEGGKSLLEYIGGDMAISRLTSRLETTVFARHYLGIVKEKHLLRRMIYTCTSVVERCHTQHEELDSFVDQVEQELFSISQDRIRDTAQPAAMAFDAAVQTIQTLLQRKGQLSGVPSGFTDLDQMTFGFQKTEMIVLAARPSVGKTALALAFAETAILPKQGLSSYRTVFFSLEMSAESLAMRMLCSRARVEGEKVRGGWINQEEMRRITSAAKELKAAPLLIDDSSTTTILEMRAKARRLHAQAPLGLIIIDYLQLIAPTDPRVPREQQVAEISRGIKAMAKEFKIPVIVLCQLNRESEKENRSPRISDLRESGSIEQDADVVLMLYRKKDKDKDQATDEPPKGPLPRQLSIAKQRNGPVGEITLAFLKDITRFENYATHT